MDRKTNNLDIGEDGITVGTRGHVGDEETEGSGKVECRNSMAMDDEQIDIESCSSDKIKGSNEYRNDENTVKITVDYTSIIISRHGIEFADELDEPWTDENCLATNDRQMNIRKRSINDTQGLDKSH